MSGVALLCTGGDSKREKPEATQQGIFPRLRPSGYVQALMQEGYLATKSGDDSTTRDLSLMSGGMSHESEDPVESLELGGAKRQTRDPCKWQCIRMARCLTDPWILEADREVSPVVVEYCLQHWRLQAQLQASSRCGSAKYLCIILKPIV